MQRRILTVALAPLLLASLVGCGGDSDGSDGGSAGGDAGGDTTITVLAAASLTGTFTELADQFESDHPGVQVKLAFDSSATLAGQAVEGAPADVLATADTGTMQDAVDGGVVAGDPTTFATNVMTLVVPADNPAGITSFAGIDSPDVDYVVCVDTAPCGKTAAALIADAGIAQQPVSLETDVKAVLAKVTSDEADAGLVYVTDVQAAGSAVKGIEFPESSSAVNTYPITTLKGSGEAALARSFVDLVLSDAGQAVLSRAGFGAP